MNKVEPDDVALKWSAERAERNRLALHESIARRKRRMHTAAVAVPLAAALLLVVVLVWPETATPSPTPPSTEPNAVAAMNPATLELRDGSWARMVTPTSRARVSIDDPLRSRVLLDQGELEVDVVPNPQREFEVVAGDVRVRVLGTRFFVEEQDEQVQVRVVHGHVRVSWPDGSAELRDGQSGLFPPNEPAPGSAPEESPEQASAAPAPARTTPAGRWRIQAAESDFTSAYRELRQEGFDTVRNTAEDLMLAADVARLSGHPAQATTPLRNLIARHATDARAPLAAFTLGRVLLEDLQRPAEAVAAFRRAQELAPGGPLFADAMIRQAEAHAASGDPEASQTIAQQYLDRFPAGRHAARARSILRR